MRAPCSHPISTVLAISGGHGPLAGWLAGSHFSEFMHQQFATKFEKNGRQKVGDLTVQKGNQCVQFVADYKAAQSRSMKRPAPSSAAGAHKQQRTSIQEYTDRQLTVEQCNKIDIAFAMFIFTMALPLRIISSVFL